MSEPVTLADIYQLFRTSAEEYDRRAEEYDRRAAESKAEYDRLVAQSKAEYDRLVAQSKAEYDRLVAQSKAEYDRHRVEIESLLAESKLESDRSMAELKRTVERTSKAVDSLTTRWGRFVEELVEPAVLRLFQEKGIDIKEVYPRARVKRQGIAMEIDILAVDDTDLVVVECKSRLSQDDVDEFIEKLTRFKIAFPHYQNYRAYGAVAGIEINEGIDRYAYKKGLFVIKPSGDTVAIINDADFQPNTW
ncbi:MAG: DUF3782 domain-containing protein [Microcystis sp. M54BS1]|jgi:hypothetical protein|uniref:DUF3782 domain-containing protein n=1 Tax=unclassified Microcystis TaxID=2643300 RepID=UPI001E178C18|nr:MULTISPECIES: DUF3782 domain-containing protein [unclassified Microcystis]MBE5232168.1 DUF3782 domain-containing protein [Microcystis aeruginosa PMC 728.11]MCA2538839.1 DUF3782 domain-containing protein [Microcystis sp. M54BS1]MCA2597577.1 DUF3782 domain-containing protein [Microcystis sp. M38BS1]MCA2608679.1 DUF3782 domain-containing protein [Microcystis sp. M27BS1]MCA2506204.1 DUF3782 domain-containing protein [Microcystis sp. M62BS1]